jgi:predicted nucleotidyltransferase
VLYQANLACPIYAELAAIFRKTIGLATLMRDALTDLVGKIDLAFVFGSMASGEQNASSDVDVLVVGDLSLAEVVKALSAVQPTLGREINPVVMTVDKFIAQLNKQDRFVTRVLDEPKIFLIGKEDEFGKLVKDRQAC